MKMNQIVGYYSDETSEAQIYDGDAPKPVTFANGLKGFKLTPVFEGKCTKEEFHQMIKKYEKNNSKTQ